MARHTLLVVAATVAALGALPAQATETASALGVSVRFDRPIVQPRQIAVAEVTVGNRGPETGGTAALRLTTSGGSIVRTRTTGGRCARPQNGHNVACRVQVDAFGTIATVVLHVRADAAARTVSVNVRLSHVHAPGDPTTATARVPVARDTAGAYAVLSFSLEAPVAAVVRRSFAARFRILNRGPGTAVIDRIRLTASPGARAVLPQLPTRLAAGAERTVVARITPLRAGRLVLDLRVGSEGRARLAINVRAAAPAT